eukprot:g487.t1
MRPGEAILNAASSVVYAERCGWWQRDYRSLQERAADCDSAAIDDNTCEGLRSVVYAVADDVKLGFADLLTGMVTAFMFALLSQRSFHIHWSSATDVWQPLIPGLFIDADVAYPEWRARAVNTIDRPRHFWESYPEHGHLFPERVHINDRSWQYYSRVDFDEVFKDSVVFIMSNRGQTYAAYENPKYRSLLQGMGLGDPDDAFGCLLRFLVRPKASVFRHHEETTPDIFSALSSRRRHYFVVGIHIRAGYELLTNLRDPARARSSMPDATYFDDFFRCARELSEAHVRSLRDSEEQGRQANTSSFLCPSTSQRRRDPLWVVFGDSDIVRDRVRETLRSMRVSAIVPAVSVGHSAGVGEDALRREACGDSDTCERRRRLKSLETAVAEHWFLSLCDRLVMPRNTGFSKTAAFMGLMKGRVYVAGPPHPANSSVLGVSERCVDGASVSFDSLGHDLAHI